MAVLNEFCRPAKADDSIRAGPVDLIISLGRMVAGVKGKMLLKENDETRLDLRSAQIGILNNGSEGLAAIAGENGVNISRKFTIEVFDQ